MAISDENEPNLSDIISILLEGTYDFMTLLQMNHTSLTKAK